MSKNLNFITSLERLGFEENKNLYFCHKEIDNPYIKIHLEEAQTFNNPNAIYFLNSNSLPPLPLIYIYDNTSGKLTREDIANLHRRLWSASKVPIFIIFSKSIIEIFSNLQAPKIDSSNNRLKEITPIQVLDLTTDIVSKFSADNLESGVFWSSDFSKFFKFQYSVYETLLNEIKNIRENLISKQIVSKETTESLLIKTILIRYLEEREVFEKNFWRNFKPNANSFIDIFSNNNALINLFDTLAKHFNGGIFQLSEKEKEELQNADLTKFKYFLLGQSQNNQLTLWSLYSFKDLPIELISNIYELFLESENKNKKGIVYTPPILVDLLIEETMPLNNPKKTLKVIDPSCGSGVFLVAAFKRLVQWWRIIHNWKKPNIQDLKELLKNNIFGVDIEKEAILLSIFSLSLALCDMLDSEKIWNELKFDNLEETKNLVHSDFFEYISKNQKKFDLVIGNPPFVSKLNTNAAKNIENSLSNNRPPLPDKQLALLFAEQSFNLLKPNGLLCLIEPSFFLYGENSFEFRNYLFSKYQCKQILDFTGIKQLFSRKSGAEVTVIALFMKKNNPKIEQDKILHITAKTTYPIKEKIFFEFSHYDLHWVDYKEALQYKYIWKINYFGGNRVKYLIQKLDKERKFKTFIEKKVKNKGWLYSDGFVPWNNGDQTAQFITGKNFISPKIFTEKGINKELISKCKYKKFSSTRTENLYKPPLLLIKKVLHNKSLPVELIEDFYVTFDNNIVGIKAAQQDIDILKKIKSRLTKFNKIFTFFIMATSGRAGIYKATSILKKDIDNLPYPTNQHSLKTSFIDNIFIDDTFNYLFDLLNGKLPKKLFQKCNEKQIKEYQTIYTNMLNSIYKNFEPYKIYKNENFVICSFYYKKKPQYSLFDELKTINHQNIFKLIENRLSSTTTLQRTIRYYDKNVIYIIKPNQYRFWLKSIAIRDADETFFEFINMEN